MVEYVADQSADLVMDVDSDIPGPRLMLMTGKNGARQWSRKRVPKHPVANDAAALQTSYTWTSWHGGDGYTRLPVTQPGLQPPVCAWGDADTRWPDRMTPAMTQTTLALGATSSSDIFGPRVIFVDEDMLWIGAGRYLNQYFIGLYTHYGSQDLGVNATATSATRFGTTWYIGVDSGANMWKVTGASGPAPGITQSADASARYSAATMHQNKLWLVTTGFHNILRSVASGADPMATANWSGPISIDSSWYDIKAVAGLSRTLYFATYNTLGAFDPDLNPVNVLPDVAKSDLDPYINQLTVWHGGLLYTHSQGLFWYQEGAVTTIGFERLRHNEYGLLKGRLTAMFPDGIWLYGVFQDIDTSAVHLVVGRERESSDPPGDGPVIWYHLQDLPAMSFPPSAMALHNNVGFANMYIPKTGNSGDVYKVLTGYQNMVPTPGGSGTITYNAASYKVLPWVHVASNGNSASLASIEVELDGAQATERVQVSYQVDGYVSRTDWTEIGPTISATGITVIPFPDSVNAHEVRLRVDFVHDTGDATKCPILRRLTLNVSERAPKNNVYTGTFRLGRGVTGRHENEMEVDPDAVLSVIDAYEDGRLPVLCIDPYGYKKRFLVLDSTVAEMENNNDPESVTLVLILTLGEVV